ncbi:MAG: hypothetical protein F4110_08565 [Acidimicrobiaceae bacterium]|nr:hypothetical protein [Acidimicrobiaceae bacterium]MYE98524.1 hypothetical protein [Acidimicrobiaceae bacterium]MYI54015.1 hypothetical protein [Acidimicrobiaceae bacterium]
MDASTFDLNTLTLVVTIMGSTLTIVILMYRQFNHLDKKFEELSTRVGTVEKTIAPIDARFDGIDARFDGIDTRFDKLEARFDAMGRDVSDARERLARIEGHLMGPGSLAPGASPAPADGLDDDHRQAG